MITKSAPSSIIQKWMTDFGLGGMPGPADVVWPIYAGFLPDGKNVPVSLMAIIDTEARENGRLLRTGERMDHPGIQITVQAQKQSTGYAKAREVAAALDKAKRQFATVDGVRYLISGISRVGGIISLGQDESRRYRWTVNATTTLNEYPS